MRCTKVLEAPAHEQSVRQTLEYLYDRRSAVETLIRSLEQYAQFGEPPVMAQRAANTAN